MVNLNSILKSLIILLWVFLFVACETDKTRKKLDYESQGVTSHKNNLKFKDGKRYAADLSSALELPRNELCKELSKFDCVDQVHGIVLGGVEPYELGVVKPAPNLSKTAPIAVDRIALSACSYRAKLDFEQVKPVLFSSAPEAEPSEEWKRNVAQGLYQRLLRRDPEAHELNYLVDFYAEVRSEYSASIQTTQDWVALSCFMLASSVENIFY